jgi:hypothetical protein
MGVLSACRKTFPRPLLAFLPGARWAPKVPGTWTFHSTTADSTDLPLLNARLTGPVSGAGTIPGGATYPFTVTTERTANAPITALGLQISYDDGATWKTIHITCDGATGKADLALPAKGGYASIRITAKDAAGSTVDQSVIRSFKVTPKK